MPKELGLQEPKFDQNSEAFQLRAQWKKADICRKQWHEQWTWLLEEKKKVLEKSTAIRAEAAATLPQVAAKPPPRKSLKPLPETTSGFYGWLANRSDCKLEVYTSWLINIPVRLPDAWEYHDYHRYKD